MGRIAGIPNKLTSEVKENLQGLLGQVLDSLDVNSMSTSEKLKYLQIVSQYIMPRLKAVYKEEGKQEDVTIFIDVK